MSVCHLLYLTGHQLSAWHWQRGMLQAAGTFAADADGLASFAAYLAIHRDQGFLLLADLAEEGYVLETIPYLWGADRRALIKRKICRHFPDTALTASISLGHEISGRKNEKLLISALTRPDQCEPWLQELKRAEAALAGIYSIAQLTGRLLKKLGLGDGPCLLLSQQGQSIRESYVNAGQTTFSRQVTSSDQSPHAMARRFVEEAGKLQQYLLGQRLTERGKTLPVFIIAHPQSIPVIEQTIPRLDDQAFEIIDSHAAARRLKLKTLPENDCSRAIFLHLLACAAPPQQFADDELRHEFRLAQIRKTLLGLSLILLLGSSLFAATESYQAQILQEEGRTLSGNAQDMGRRYQAIAETFPQLDVDHETLRHVTNRYGELIRQQRSLTPGFEMLGRALTEAPDIKLKNIDWKIANAGAEEIITLQGAIEMQGETTPRQVIGRLEQFTKHLRANSGYTVDIEREPFSANPGQPLTGGDTDPEQAVPAHFSLRITRQVTP